MVKRTRPKSSSSHQVKSLRRSAEQIRQTAGALEKGAKATYQRADQLHQGSIQMHANVEPTHQHIRELKTRAKMRKLPQDRQFPIVGVGASAGGLESMMQMLRHLPGNTGMSFVLVQHLDPTHKSALTSLLSRATSMTVAEAKHNMRLEPNHLYVIPPNKTMDISGRRLKLSPRRDGREIHTPIDHFLKSLAESEGNSSIGIILSGNGSDGTTGLQAIKAEGGITFAQEEKTAKYSAMPASAITAGCVDFVMAPEEIARELARISGHPYVTPGRTEEQRPLPAEDKAYEDILTTLRHRVGVDFTHYKHATLRRRIERRMVLHKFEKCRDYAEFVRSHTSELKELFNDILIHVTGFFRDPKVFQTLKQRVFPRILKGKGEDEPVRVWVPGCSSGEEVYSLAMALVEYLHDKKIHHSLQIFGTDINETALEKARAGNYPASIREDMTAERLRRFFVKVEGGYRISKAIREMCIFARQNVIVDPPFSNLDLISCRNVLIYLGPVLQRKIMPLFHYSLRANGLLLLGASETIGSFDELFTLVNKKAKVYSKKSAHSRPPLMFGHGFEPTKLEAGGEFNKAPLVGPTLSEIQKQADRILLTHYGPAGVIINSQMEVLQFRGRTGVYLEHSHGEASLNLLKMARESLAVDLRTAVGRAIKQNARVRHEGARVRQNGHTVDVTIEVVPFQVPPLTDRFFLVLMESAPLPGEELETKKKAEKLARQREGVQSGEMAQLREELASTRESLQAIIEEQEATNEELRSANEEIMSSNEELQSTNEELETAKEELQSTNEELTTLNDELETRNNEMERINNDLHNLLASVNIPIIILGPDLRIRRFTAVAETLFHLIPSDVGRPVTDIALTIQVPNFAKLVMEVIDSLSTREIETRDKEGRWWSLRIRPYRTTDNKIDGAVIALVDIDLLKSAGDLSHSNALGESIVNTVHEPLLVLDKNLMVKNVNQAFCAMFKIHRESALDRRIYEVGDGKWNVPALRRLLENLLPHQVNVENFAMKHDVPEIGIRNLLVNARRLAVDGKRELMLLAIQDVTGRKTKTNTP